MAKSSGNSIDFLVKVNKAPVTLLINMNSKIKVAFECSNGVITKVKKDN